MVKSVLADHQVHALIRLLAVREGPSSVHLNQVVQSKLLVQLLVVLVFFDREINAGHWALELLGDLTGSTALSGAEVTRLAYLHEVDVAQQDGVVLLRAKKDALLQVSGKRLDLVVVDTHVDVSLTPYFVVEVKCVVRILLVLSHLLFTCFNRTMFFFL